MEDSAPKKGHHARQAGPKAERKKEREKAKRGVDGQPKHNSLAFGVAHGRSAGKNMIRKLDHAEKKYHLPAVNR